MTDRDRLSIFAIAAPGLAPIVAREVRALGSHRVTVLDSGVAFRGSISDLYAANLWLRAASRVLVRFAEFHADSFHELERRAGRLAWRDALDPATPVRIRVTCRKSRLYHSDAVAERIAAQIARQGGSVATAAAGEGAAEAGSDDAESDVPAAEQLIVVRLDHDRCTVSLDSSGELLHRRGYRLETAKAPLRENIAAALLMASGWSDTATAPLLDPMCGAGTIAIEAALLARRRPPGISRTFAFMRWPNFDRGAWDSLVARAREGEQRPTGPILIGGSDRDQGAVGAARSNAERAGIGDMVEIERRTISEIRPSGPPGWIVTNPPYGVRIGERRGLRDLYAQIGNVVRKSFADWRVALLVADRRLAGETRLPLASRLRTVNGGLRVELMVSDSIL